MCITWMSWIPVYTLMMNKKECIVISKSTGNHRKYLEELVSQTAHNRRSNHLAAVAKKMKIYIEYIYAFKSVRSLTRSLTVTENPEIGTTGRQY